MKDKLALLFANASNFFTRPQTILEKALVEGQEHADAGEAFAAFCRVYAGLAKISPRNHVVPVALVFLEKTALAAAENEATRSRMMVFIDALPESNVLLSLRMKIRDEIGGKLAKKYGSVRDNLAKQSFDIGMATTFTK